MRVSALPLHELPVAVVDVEVTGFVAGLDRIVEVSVLRVDPGEAPAIALDTLVQPRRAMGARQVHGISAEDVAHAPTFAEVVGEVARALAGRVVVGHNVGFDLRFLRKEFEAAGFELPRVPFIDTMMLRPALGDGPRASLREMCASYALAVDPNHVASSDIRATFALLATLLNRARFAGFRTLADLARCGRYAFIESLRHPVIDARWAASLPTSLRRVSRYEQGIRRAVNELALYGDALMVALSDLVMTDEEVANLRAMRTALGVSDGAMRRVHAQAFAAAMATTVGDGLVSDQEADMLLGVSRCLRRAGWCPGH